MHTAPKSFQTLVPWRNYYLSWTVKTSMKEWCTYYVRFDLCHIWPYHIFPECFTETWRTDLFINLISKTYKCHCDVVILGKHRSMETFMLFTKENTPKKFYSRKIHWRMKKVFGNLFLIGNSNVPSFAITCRQIVSLHLCNPFLT